MKKNYTAPELEITTFELSADILTESAEQSFEQGHIYIDDRSQNGPFGF